MFMDVINLVLLGHRVNKDFFLKIMKIETDEKILWVLAQVQS